MFKSSKEFEGMLAHVLECIVSEVKDVSGWDYKEYTDKDLFDILEFINSRGLALDLDYQIRAGKLLINPVKTRLTYEGLIALEKFRSEQ